MMGFFNSILFHSTFGKGGAKPDKEWNGIKIRFLEESSVSDMKGLMSNLRTMMLLGFRVANQ